MVRALKAFGIAFAAGGVLALVGFFASDLVPEKYQWCMMLGMVFILWAFCLAAAATRRPLTTQFSVVAGVSWGFLVALSVANSIQHHRDYTDWTAMLPAVIVMPLVILVTASLACWAWRAIRARRSAESFFEEQPQPGVLKRLPGLWVICVFMGLGAMFVLTSALLTQLPWAILRGTLAVLQLALAAALWMRLRTAWCVAMVLLGLGLAWFVLSGFVLSHAHALMYAIGCILYLVVGLYFWLRRRHFGRADVPRPRVVSIPGVCALAVVLVLGGGYLLLATVDERRESFPELEVQVPVPPEQDNGYVLIEQMREKWPLQDDEQLTNLRGGLQARVGAPDPVWLGKARAIVEKYQGCLADARELVKKPHFVEVTSLQGMDWVGRPMKWLEFSRRLALLLGVSAEVQAADGHWRQALDEADRVMALGMLMSKESRTMIENLVGNAILAIGLHDLRTVASAVPDAALLKGHLGPPLPEAELRQGYNLGMAGEFQGDVGLLEEFRKLNQRDLGTALGVRRDTSTPPDLFQRLSGASPYFKLNITRNLLGRGMDSCLMRGDTYTPPPPGPFSDGGLWDIARRMGYLRFARDPMGVLCLLTLGPLHDRSLRVSYSTIAGARLTQIFIALRCNQLEHGKMPEKLDALAPEYLKAIPLDPFSGKPLGYEPGGQKPRIWSAGPDQQTDPPDAKNGDDIVVGLDFAGR